MLSQSSKRQQLQTIQFITAIQSLYTLHGHPTVQQVGTSRYHDTVIRLTIACVWRDRELEIKIDHRQQHTTSERKKQSAIPLISDFLFNCLGWLGSWLGRKEKKWKVAPVVGDTFQASPAFICLSSPSSIGIGLRGACRAVFYIILPHTQLKYLKKVKSHDEKQHGSGKYDPIHLGALHGGENYQPARNKAQKRANRASEKWERLENCPQSTRRRKWGGSKQLCTPLGTVGVNERLV